MADLPLHNLDEAILELRRIAIRTTRGEFVRVDDVRKIMEKRAETQTVSEAVEPKPKTVEQARAAIRKDPEIMKHFPSAPREPGRSVPASDPQSPSRA